jgi:hypothetical protein|tara:strand:+ start:12029 stop:12274 length:246 start_codon:yes stop_codon:yes gene_type:complete
MTEKTKKAEAPVDAPTQSDNAEAAPDLTIQDLATLKQIIDVATSRGAFKANELEGVGKAYNKLDTFLTTIAEQQAQGAATE